MGNWLHLVLKLCQFGAELPAFQTSFFHVCYVMKWCHITVFCSMENQTPVFGGQTSQTQPLFANDQWAYCLSASIEQLDGQHSQQVTITYLIDISFGYQFILILLCTAQLWHGVSIFLHTK
jgi:hypothetical protein